MTDAASIHADAIVIDGLQCCDFDRPLLEEGIRRIDEFPDLTVEMHLRGWSEARITAILGGNWLRLLDEVWHDA